MSNSANVVSIAVHPKFTRNYVSLDMEGHRFLVGDLFIDLVGSTGEILQIQENGYAIVATSEQPCSYIVETDSLLRQKR